MGFQLKHSNAEAGGLAETNWDALERSQNQDQTESSATSTVESQTVDVPVLRRAAMDFLARREHSSRELHHKMQLKFPDTSSQLLDEVLGTLAEEGLQSDERFTESWVRYRQSRGFGFHHIRSDLRERGIANALIEKYLFSDDDCWKETAISLVNKRLTESEQIEFGSPLHRKIQRYLKSRGFGNQEIQFALKSRLTTH